MNNASVAVVLAAPSPAAQAAAVVSKRLTTGSPRVRTAEKGLERY